MLSSGGARRWGVADALLPITESMSWNPRPCRKKGKATSPTVTASSPFSSTGGAQELDAYQVVDSTGYQGDRIYNTEDAFGTLPSQGGNNGGGAGGLIAPCYNSDQVAGTLRARDAKGVGFDEAELNKLVVNALDTECGASKLNHQTILNHTIAFNHDAGKQFSPAATEDFTPTLRAKPDQGTAVSNPGQAIRRLTPKECERLQGFDDDYTKIPFKGKMVGDAPRYKALGNSMAVPVMKYIGQQIQKVYGNEEK